LITGNKKKGRTGEKKSMLQVKTAEERTSLLKKEKGRSVKRRKMDPPETGPEKT